MSDYRKNHYVSQFQLRAFGKSQREIQLFNIEHKIFVENASIRNQCKKNGFHDFNPEFEKELGKLETEVARTLSRIEEEQTLSITPDQYDNLLLFIVLQRGRTLAAANSSERMTDLLAKSLMSEDTELGKIDRDTYEITNTYPSELPIRAAIESFPIARALQPHLFINDTTDEFILGDNPAVAHNMYCESIKHRGSLGLNCSGIQLFFPISPKVLIYLFDPYVYKVRNMNSSMRSSLSRRSDIRYLNALQYLNADRCIYFKTGQEGIDKIHEQFSRLRQEKNGQWIESDWNDEDDEGKSRIIHAFETMHNIPQSISAVNIRKEASKIPISKRLSKVGQLSSDSNGLSSPKGASLRYAISEENIREY